MSHLGLRTCHARMGSARTHHTGSVAVASEAMGRTPACPSSARYRGCRLGVAEEFPAPAIRGDFAELAVEVGPDASGSPDLPRAADLCPGSTVQIPNVPAKRLPESAGPGPCRARWPACRRPRPCGGGGAGAVARRERHAVVADRGAGGARPRRAAGRGGAGRRARRGAAIPRARPWRSTPIAAHTKSAYDFWTARPSVLYMARQTHNERRAVHVGRCHVERPAVCQNHL